MSGRVLIPAEYNEIKELPSVDAIAIPPWLAVVSVGFVVNPRTISLSPTVKVLAAI